ncbi:Hypothetical predicted protein [Octopus vulgaris]|uniref:Uncharacterized protein n=3 Tax=Octopus TaxID=6643 RepID=A0AA36ATD3_OCTVU|nr:PRA1 family protein 3 [Octopus sinensis]CAI9721935.1 Hypothetical predicted protein [Octopus vulgaris]
MMADLQLAPLRPIGDFLMESARFQMPNMVEADKWTKRVLQNLLYYQTNYFLTALFVFLIIGVIHPVKMVFGFVAIAAAFGGFVFCTNNQWKSRKFKRDHPIISVLIVLGAGYLLVYMLGAVIVFLLGVAFPLMLILLHASLRMRSIKNKLANKMEYIGLKRSPMGIILEGFGQDHESG